MRTVRLTSMLLAAVLVSTAAAGPVRAADGPPLGEGTVGPFRLVGPDGFDGYVVRPAAPTLLDQVRSLITTGGLADPLASGAAAVATVGGEVRERLDAPGILVADLTEAEAQALAASPRVTSVHPNLIIRQSVRVATESDPASWGLGFIDRDHRTAGLDESYRFTSDGSGVDVYIVDTGIETSHPDFTGRVPIEPAGGWFRIRGADGVVTDSVAPTDDCNGHGTHVAGSAAGNLSGVARGANLIPVKVFPECDRETSSANIIAGLQWILDQIPEGGLARPAVVNMSLGGLSAIFDYFDRDGVRYFFVRGAESAYDPYVQQLIDAGMTVVVAAGNDSWPALWYTPAHVADAITVGSTGRAESGGNFGDISGDAIRPATSPRFGMNIESSYSNFGPELDLYAPGAEIVSACTAPNALGSGGSNAGCGTATVDGVTFAAIAIGGTSMAAPHVAGMAARILGAEFAATNTILTPAQVRAALVGGATPIVRVLEADFAAPDIILRVGGIDYRVPLTSMRENDPSLTPSVDFSTTNLHLNTVFAEPAGPTRLDVPALQACAQEVVGVSAPLAVGGVAPFVWTASAPAPAGYLTARGIIGGSLAAAAAGDVAIGVEDAFGRTASRTFSQSVLPPGCLP